MRAIFNVHESSCAGFDISHFRCIAFISETLESNRPGNYLVIAVDRRGLSSARTSRWEYILTPAMGISFIVGSIQRPLEVLLDLERRRLVVKAVCMAVAALNLLNALCLS
jgi:hypothetical protein